MIIVHIKKGLLGLLARNKIHLLFLSAMILLTSLSAGQSQAGQEKLLETKDKDIIDLINNTGPQRRAEESARYLLYEEEYSVKKDGRVVRTIHILIKFFSEKGKRLANVAIKSLKALQIKGTFRIIRPIPKSRSG